MITSHQRRKYRVRNSISKNNKSFRPRLVVNRSNKNLYAQLIGVDGNVIASYSTLNLQDEGKNITGIEKAKAVGKEFAKICLGKGVLKIVFDKGSYSYSGRVKSIAESCREAGLQF